MPGSHVTVAGTSAETHARQSRTLARDAREKREKEMRGKEMMMLSGDTSP